MSPDEEIELSSPLPSRPTSLKENIAILSLGLLVNTFVFNYTFDYLLYPFVVWKLGILKGGLVMTVLAGLTCYPMFLFYDWSKKDWLGIEKVKSLKDYSGTTKMGKITSWVLKKSDSFVLLFLSIKFDAFITTIYLRSGSYQYNGFNKRDLKIFFISLLISNIYWTLASFMGVTLVEYAWRHLCK